MPFQPGHKLSPGRTKGAKNKKTQLFEALLKEHDIEIIRDIKKEFDNLKPVEKVYCLLKMAEFVYPKRKAIEVSGELALGILPDNKDDRINKVSELQDRIKARKIAA
jgi:hypothetical protein